MSITLVNRLLVPAVIFLSLHSVNLHAQCTSTGPRSAATAASVSFGGSDFSFSNATNIFSSDNNRATSTGLITLFTGETEYLQATNFGFSVPPAAIICGITVEVEKSVTGIGTVLGIGLSYVTDYSVRLVRNGSVVGNNKASATHWSNSENYHSYGGSNDIWGVAWTPADINASNFGIAISANINGLAMLIPNVRLDHLRITVHYNVALLPAELLFFNATTKRDGTTLIEWQTTMDKLLPDYTVQRSGDGLKWETVEGAWQQSLLSGRYHYSMKDMQPLLGKSYYRLRTKAASGAVSYSGVKAVKPENYDRVKVYPNPFAGRIVIAGYSKNENIRLTDLSGRAIPVSISTTGIMNLHSLYPGVYILHIGNKMFKIQKQE